MTAPTSEPTAQRIAELRGELAYPYQAEHHVNDKGRPWCSLTVGELRYFLAAGARLVEAESLVADILPELRYLRGRMKGMAEVEIGRLVERATAFLSPPPPAGKDGER